MAKCKVCSKSSWFQSVDKMGMCDRCRPVHGEIIQNHCRIAIESDKIIRTTKNIKTLLSRIDVAHSSCLELLPYHKRGIPTLTISPDEMIRRLNAARVEAVEIEIRSRQFTAREKYRDATTDAAKLGGYGKAIEVLTGLMDQVHDVSALESAIFDLRRERDAQKAKLIVRKAEVQVAKGKEKRAIELLIEAMMSLKHDTTPDEYQQDAFRIIRAEIERLGGTAPI